MRAVFLTFAVCLTALVFAQTHTVPGHYDKNGKWIPRHIVKDRPDPADREMIIGFKNPPKKDKNPPPSKQQPGSHNGQHREHRYYPGHYAKDGHYIPATWRWVWVKN